MESPPFFRVGKPWRAKIWPRVTRYQPFIDDPKDLARLEGQRYIVLRPTGPVSDIHRHVQAVTRERLADGDVSYPACAHVTLTGFPVGTELAAIRQLAGEWARGIAPLRIEVERVHHFPSPFQILIVQVRKTPELFGALASLRALTSGPKAEVSLIPPADWVFHMSVAYCASLDVSAWAEVARFFETLSVPAAHCTLSEVEIVAFDNRREYSGGAVELRGSIDGRKPESTL